MPRKKAKKLNRIRPEGPGLPHPIIVRLVAKAIIKERQDKAIKDDLIDHNKDL